MRTKLILGGLLILVLCATAAVAENSSLRVIGEGSVLTPADTVIIAVSAQSSDDNATIAAEKNSQLLNETVDALINAGVKDDEIMPGRSKGYMRYHNLICNTENNTTTCEDVVKSLVTERMIVKLKADDENETQRVIEAAKSAGAGADVMGYSLSDPDKAIDEARKKALEDARSQAKNYAESFGFKLGKSFEIEEIAYPDIEIGPSYANDWDMPMRMHGMFWRGGFPHMGRFFGEEYIPEGMAKVTAYVGVNYEVV